MSVRIRPHKGRKDKWEVDIRYNWPDGTKHRERKVSPFRSKSQTTRWAEARERKPNKRGLEQREEQIHRVLSLGAAIGLVVVSGCAPNVCNVDGPITLGSQLLDLEGCQEINGDLDIRTDSRELDLSALSRLQRIDGRLSIVGSGLQSTLGIHNIENVVGPIDISLNEYLVTVADMPVLQYAGGFFILENGALEKVDGFNDLRRLGGDLAIKDNVNLTAITGFRTLSLVDGSVDIRTQSPDGQARFEGLHALSSLGVPDGEKYISIVAAQTTALHALPAVWPYSLTLAFDTFAPPTRLREVSGDLWLSFGSDLNGFSGLRRVGGRFVVGGAEGTDLAPIQLLESAGELLVIGLHADIGRFDALTQVQSIEVKASEFLTTLDAFNSVAETQRVVVFGNVERPGQLTVVDGFESLERVSGLLNIAALPVLEDIVGFRSLTSVGGTDYGFAGDGIGLGSLPALQNITAFRNIESLRGVVSLRSLPLGDGDFPVWDAESLTLIVLEDLAVTSFAFLPNVREASQLLVEDNSTLTSIGLDQLVAVSDAIRIRNNPLLDCDDVDEFVEGLAIEDDTIVSVIDNLGCPAP